MQQKYEKRSFVLGSTKGHLALNSSAYKPCVNKLSSQYLIQDQMTSHYYNLATIKSAIDNKPPKSTSLSIKKKDQLQREALLKQAKTPKSPREPQINVKSHPSINMSTTLHDSTSPYAHSTNRSFSASSSWSPTQYKKVSRSQNTKRPATGLSHKSFQTSRSVKSAATVQNTPNNPKTVLDLTYSGDYLDKHCERFHNSENTPFTPRTKKRPGKSFLSQSKHYTPPPQPIHKQDSKRSEAKEKEYENITEDNIKKRKNEDMDKSDYQRKWIEEQSEFVQRLSLIEQEEQERTSKNRGSRPSTGKSTTRRLLDEEENELKYLHFVNEVTSDILSTGVYSDSVLYRLMERHVNKRIHELDEGKMWGVLDKLRKDLGMLEGRKKSSASASSQRQFKSGSIVLKDIEYSRERESSFSSRKDKKVSQMSPPGSISSMKSLKSVQNRKEDADFDSSFQQEKLKSLVKSSPVPHKRSSLSRASSSNANEFEKEISKTKRESTEVVDGEAKQSRASQRRASENSLKSRSNHDSIEELYAGSVSSKDLMEKNDAGNYRPSVAADRRRSSLGNVGSEFYVTSSGQLIDGRSSEDVVAEAVSEVASKVVVEVVESVKSGDGRVTPTPTQDLTVESALPPNEEESVTGYESDYESVAALSMVMKPKETSDDAMKSCPAIEPLVRKRGSSQAQRSKDCLFLPKEEETTKPLEHDGDDAYSDDFQEDSDDNF